MATCSVDGCNTPSRALGFCIKHHRRFKAHGDPLGAAPGAKATCSVADCEHGGKITLGYCTTHYQRFKKWGDPLYVESQKNTDPLPGCTVDGCPRSTRNHSSPYCEKHYSRVKRHGDAGIVFKDHTPASERWKTSYVVTPGPLSTPCWVWTKRGMPGGYGLISDGADNDYVAHRFVWEQLVGSIADGMELDHLCRNKPCVNPEHLEPVPGPVNQLRAAAARRDGLPETTVDVDQERTRVRELMRKRRANWAADPSLCNRCGKPLAVPGPKWCDDCQERKRQQNAR